jgi:hypothetical protein
MGPHAADVHDGPAAARLDHAAHYRLGQEEDGPAQLGVGVVVGAVMVKVGLGEEAPGRVDQQGSVRVLVGQLLTDPLGLLPVGQVGGNAVASPVLGQ